MRRGVVLNTTNSTFQREKNSGGQMAPCVGHAALDGVGGSTHSPGSLERQAQNSCLPWVPRGRGLTSPDGDHTCHTCQGPAQRRRGRAAPTTLTPQVAWQVGLQGSQWTDRLSPARAPGRALSHTRPWWAPSWGEWGGNSSEQGTPPAPSPSLALPYKNVGQSDTPAISFDGCKVDVKAAGPRGFVGGGSAPGPRTHSPCAGFHLRQVC